MGIATAAVAATLVAASPAAAAQRYAAPSGSGSACTSQSPCGLHNAFTGANNGDEIIVTPGDYGPITSTLATMTNGYAHGVAGQPPPRIHFGSGGYISVGGAGARLSYLQLDGTNPATLQIDIGAEADQISVHTTNTGACLVYGTLIDSICWASGPNDDAIAGGASANYTPVLRNVTAEATGSNSNAVDYNASGSGSLTVTAVNLIADGAGSSDIFATATLPATTSITIDHSSFGSAGGSGSGADITSTNKLNAAPLFVNAAAGDYREAAGSPTIDAGVTSAANGPFDLIGRPRVINSATDIGAYEFDPFAGVTLANQKSKVKKRKAKVTIGCPAGTPTSCTGTLTLTFGSKTAGSTPFAIAPGTSVTLKLKISKKALKRLDKKGKLRTQATAAATDGVGVAATTTGAVKLKR